MGYVILLSYTPFFLPDLYLLAIQSFSKISILYPHLHLVPTSLHFNLSLPYIPRVSSEHELHEQTRTNYEQLFVRVCLPLSTNKTN